MGKKVSFNAMIFMGSRNLLLSTDARKYSLNYLSRSCSMLTDYQGSLLLKSLLIYQYLLLYLFLNYEL